jgi:CBS domain-containing protein
MSGSRCVGTVSVQEVMAVPVDRRDRTTLADIVKSLPDSQAIDSQMPATQASQLLASLQDHPVPVVSGTAVVGLLRSSDILKWLMFQNPGGQQEG